MATLEITNITGEPVPLGDFYTSVAPGCSIKVERPIMDLASLRTLQEAVAARKVTLSVSYTAAELQMLQSMSGAPNPVNELDALATPVTVYRKIKKGGTEEEIFPPGTLPARMRLLECTFSVVDPGGFVELRDASGGGNLLAALDTSVPGRSRYEGCTSMVEPSRGLYLCKSDSDLVGELVALGRFEL